jgi:hypothetical protein
MAALIGPDLENFGRCDTVEPGPVKTVITVMHLTGDSGHEGYGIILPLGQGADGLGKGDIINRHGARVRWRKRPKGGRDEFKGKLT